MSDVTNNGITSVAQSKLTKTNMARQFCCSTILMIGKKRRMKKTIVMPIKVSMVELNSHVGHRTLPTGV